MAINIIIMVKNVHSSYPVVNASSTGINLVDKVAIYKSEIKAPGIKYLKIKRFVIISSRVIHEITFSYL